MNPTVLLRMVSVVSLVASYSVSATAAPWYFGTYKTVRAQTAPWVSRDFVPDVMEIAIYLDKSIVIGTSIDGPGLLKCATPTYDLKKVDPAYLFEGGLATGDKPEAAADAAAKKLGFSSGEIQALETGCESEITFHFRNQDTAAFALDNIIYWLERQ